GVDDRRRISDLLFRIRRDEPVLPRLREVMAREAGLFSALGNARVEVELLPQLRHVDDGRSFDSHRNLLKKQQMRRVDLRPRRTGAASSRARIGAGARARRTVFLVAATSQKANHERANSESIIHGDQYTRDKMQKAQESRNARSLRLFRGKIPAASYSPT